MTSKEEAIQELAAILNRADLRDHVTPWLKRDDAAARYYVDDLQLRPCAMISVRTMSKGRTYEVNVFFNGESAVADKISTMERAKAVADLMLRQFGATLIEEKE